MDDAVTAMARGLIRLGIEERKLAISASNDNDEIIRLTSEILILVAQL